METVLICLVQSCFECATGLNIKVHPFTPEEVDIYQGKKILKATCPTGQVASNVFKVKGLALH